MLQSNNTAIKTELTNEPFVPVMYEIKRIQRETEDTFTIDLILPDKKKTNFRFKPGQFNSMFVHGCGEVPISISGNPIKNEKIVHTIRVVGTVTRAIRRLKVGEYIGIRGPFGSHWPVEKAVDKNVIIIAGGIGLAPIRPAVYHILEHREKYKDLSILYGARTPDDIIFKKELESIRGRFDIDLHVTVDRADNKWMGNVGVVPTLAKRITSDPSNSIAFVCGPEIMMRYSAVALQQYGMSLQDIYISLERNMKCGIGLCGHCQYTGKFICKDGPVYSYETVKDLLKTREI
ncbi:MAG: Ni/Fe hydrogenase subunit gamma [Calditrichaeota bacterium]|nr:MAG: Ni/Fe hydrogenase subunit gamma [Calditrichota bacterium]